MLRGFFTFVNDVSTWPFFFAYLIHLPAKADTFFLRLKNVAILDACFVASLTSGYTFYGGGDLVGIFLISIESKIGIGLVASSCEQSKRIETKRLEVQQNIPKTSEPIASD